jgi:hypothetical protein
VVDTFIFFSSFIEMSVRLAEITAIVEKIIPIVDELKKIDEKRRAKVLEAKKKFCSIDEDDAFEAPYFIRNGDKEHDLRYQLGSYSKSLVVWTSYD